MNRLLVSLVLALLVLAGLKMFVFEIARVQGNDMAPTLVAGDLVLLNRLGTPERGDVVVFEHPHEVGRSVLRRIVGIPGDSVELTRGKLSVNGQAAARTSGGRLLMRNLEDGKDRMLDLVVEDLFGRGWRVLDDPRRKPPAQRRILGGSGCVVLSDNRDHGRDSREYGPIRREAIRGVALLILQAGRGTSPTLDAQARSFSRVR